MKWKSKEYFKDKLFRQSFKELWTEFKDTRRERVFARSAKVNLETYNILNESADRTNKLDKAALNLFRKTLKKEPKGAPERISLLEYYDEQSLLKEEYKQQQEKRDLLRRKRKNEKSKRL